MRISFEFEAGDAAAISAAIATLYKLLPTPATIAPGLSTSYGGLAPAPAPTPAPTPAPVPAPAKDIVWARQQLKPFLDDPVGKKVAGAVLRGEKYGVTELDKVKDFEAFVKDVDAAFKAAKAAA